MKFIPFVIIAPLLLTLMLGSSCPGDSDSSMASQLVGTWSTGQKDNVTIDMGGGPITDSFRIDLNVPDDQTYEFLLYQLEPTWILLYGWKCTFTITEGDDDILEITVQQEYIDPGPWGPSSGVYYSKVLDLSSASYIELQDANENGLYENLQVFDHNQTVDFAVDVTITYSRQ